MMTNAKRYVLTGLPRLTCVTLTPRCLQLAAKLVRCHEEHPWKKFIGACNDAHDQVLICFRVCLKLVTRLGSWQLSVPLPLTCCLGGHRTRSVRAFV